MHGDTFLGFAVAMMGIVVGVQNLRIVYRGTYRVTEAPTSLTKKTSVTEPLTEFQRRWLKLGAYCSLGIGALVLVLCLASVFHWR